MNSGNWIIDNLMYALKVWNEKLAEIWQLIIQSPQSFKGGTIWNVIVSINGALKAVGTALLVLFFLVGVVKTAGSFSEVKRPEHALKLFVRFAIAKGVITYGLDLMTAIFRIVQGVISTAMHTANIGTVTAITLPTEITNAAGEPSSHIGKSFLKSYAAVCLEGAIIVLGCIIFSIFTASPPAVDTSASASTMVWTYLGELIFNLLVLTGTIKMADRVVREMFGL